MNAEPTIPAETAATPSPRVKLRDFSIHAFDAYKLAATLYLPERLAPTRKGEDDGKDDGYIVVINSGAGVKRGYYHKFASYLAEAGLRALTYDYRGIGDSLRAPIQNFDTSISEWGEKDCVAALKWATENYPNARLIVVGHSAGGKIPGFAYNNSCIDALITVASPNSYWGFWHWWGKRSYFLFVQFFMPALTHLLSYFPARFLGLGENFPKGVALQWSRWSRRKAYLLHPKRGHFPNYFASLRGEVLSLSFSDDIIATGKAVNAFMNFYSAAKSRRHWHIHPKDYGIVDSIGHSGFFRSACEPLWARLVGWITRGDDVENPAFQTPPPKALHQKKRCNCIKIFL